MINALNLKLQVLTTSLRLLKKPTQTYLLECKMLLIKYFRNTKAICFFKHRNPLLKDRHHKHVHCRQRTRNKTASSGKMQQENLAFSFRPCPGDPHSFVQTHRWTLVHAHVCVTEKPPRAALDSSGVQGVQVFRRHLQVLSHFRAWGNLRNVEAVLTTYGEEEEFYFGQ